jgi:uncharacterized HAD superfamily protein
MSLPFSAIAIFFKNGQGCEFINEYRLPISIVLFFTSAIGLGVFCYIVNLRLDAITYSRVVNGIRKFFYDKFDEDINLKLRWRTLPQSPQLPSYFERSYFIPAVFVFAIMNGLYFFLGYYIAYIASDPRYRLIGIVTALVFIFLHFGIYFWYSDHREVAYLKSLIIGIDIDGVLNKHREHFCKILEKKTGKKVNPDEILIMPVYECPSLNITIEDERKVFNDPEYWTEMPPIKGSADIIRRLKNIYNLDIYIFTYRPWPDLENEQELIEKIKLFCQNSKGSSLQLWLLKIGITLKLRWLIRKYKEEPLRLITEQWLRKNGFSYKKLFLEKGNDYSSDPGGRFTNRFYFSRKEKIRFFVEDDYEKAVKLSFICDVVFLLSHPYNEPNEKLSSEVYKLRKNLPSNIIRVKNWDEIYYHIRRLA